MAIVVSAQTLALAGDGQSVGLVRSSNTLGLPIGVILGGAIADHMGFVGTFAFGVVASAVSCVLALRLLTEVVSAKPSSPLRFSMPGGQARSMAALTFCVTFSAVGVVLTCVSTKSGPFAFSAAPAALLLGSLVLSLVVGNLIRVGGVGVAVGVLVSSVVVLALPLGVFTQVAALILCGLSAGRLSTLAVSRAAKLSDEADRAAAVSVSQFAGDLGGALGPLAATALVAFGSSAPLFIAAVVVAVVALLAETGRCRVT
jgi:MFS family permease